MNLNDIVGKRIASVSCEPGSPMKIIMWAAQMTFDDGSVLDIDIKGQHGDAWLEFEYIEGLTQETKTELDGPSWAHGTKETNPYWPYEGPAQGWIQG